MESPVGQAYPTRGTNKLGEKPQESRNKILIHDRRRYPRLKGEFEVEFRPMDALGAFKKSLTEDMNLGGLRIDLPKSTNALLLNQLVELNLRDPSGRLDPLNAMGKVVWIQKRDDGRGFEAGILLTYMKEEVRKRFAHYLEEHLSFKKTRDND